MVHVQAGLKTQEKKKSLNTIFESKVHFSVLQHVILYRLPFFSLVHCTILKAILPQNKIFDVIEYVLLNFRFL